MTFTQSNTGFTAHLVEKDYFCSLVLEDLCALANPPWAFKGGTCLSKVHSDFCRMSEDLDIAYSVPVDVPRSARSKTIVAMKDHLAEIGKRLKSLTVTEALRGFNNSTQYIGSLSYESVVTGQEESIKVEFSIREPILEPIEELPARTLLIDPFRRLPAVLPLSIPVLSSRETYAEKLRAALTRASPQSAISSISTTASDLGV